MDLMLGLIVDLMDQCILKHSCKIVRFPMLYEICCGAGKILDGSGFEDTYLGSSFGLNAPSPVPIRIPALRKLSRGDRG